MKKQRVVCILPIPLIGRNNGRKHIGPRPQVREIYTVVWCGKFCDSLCYQLEGFPNEYFYLVKYFRPVDDTFGEVVAERIEEMVEYEQATKEVTV